MRFTQIILTIIILTFLSSCSHKEGTEPHTLQVTFSLNGFNNTRADNPIIKADTLSILLFSSYGNLISHHTFPADDFKASFSLQVPVIDTNNITIAALTNVELKHWPENINQLRETPLPQPISHDEIPLYGETEASIDLNTPGVSITLKSPFAKIILNDNLENGNHLLAASVLTYERTASLGEALYPDSHPKSPSESALTQLEFTPDKDQNSFFVYVPYTQLKPDSNDSLREINLKIDDNGQTATRKIFFAPYLDGEVDKESLSNTEWSAILPNHLYTFNISSQTSTEPIIYPNITILYQEHNAIIGKFNTSKIYLFTDDGFLTSRYGEVGKPYRDTNFLYINITLPDNIDIQKIHYRMYAEGYDEDLYDFECYLWEDKVKTENLDNRTLIYLTGEIMAENRFLSNHPFRIYFRARDVVYAHAILNSDNSTYLPSRYTQLKYDDRGYKYFDFNLVNDTQASSSNKMYIHCFDSDVDGWGETATLHPTDIDLQEIDGSYYYVFYYD